MDDCKNIHNYQLKKVFTINWKIFKKKFALQIMFINENKSIASELAALARQINPDEVQINTPLRECPSKPLSKEEISDIMKHFKGLNAISVYD